LSKGPPPLLQGVKFKGDYIGMSKGGKHIERKKKKNRERERGEGPTGVGPSNLRGP